MSKYKVTGFFRKKGPELLIADLIARGIKYKYDVRNRTIRFEVDSYQNYVKTVKYIKEGGVKIIG